MKKVFPLKRLKTHHKVFMNIIKRFWQWLVAIIGTIIALLLFYFQRKYKEVKALNSEIDSLHTERQTDLLEIEINTIKQNKDLNKKHNEELDKSLIKLEEKRIQIAEEVKNLKTPKEISSYWNNQ